MKNDPWIKGLVIGVVFSSIILSVLRLVKNWLMWGIGMEFDLLPEFDVKFLNTVIIGCCIWYWVERIIGGGE